MSVTVREQPREHSRRATRLVIAAVLLLLLIGGGIWAYMKTRPEPARVVRRDIVALAALQSEVVAPPNARADVDARFEAPVVRVMVSVNENVDNGTPMVELSHPNAQAAYQQAQANLRAAETNLANAKQQYSAAVVAAKQNVATAQQSGDPLMVSTAQQQLADAQADVQVALAPFEQQVAWARDQAAQARSGKRQAEIRAPIDGTVLALNAAPGKVVSPEDKVPVATIVNLNRLQLQAPLDSDWAGYVKPKMDVEIRFAELGDTVFEGEVYRVTTQPASGLSGAKYVAIVNIENRDRLVRPGMKAKAGIKIGSVKDVLAVPSEAVDKDDTGRPVIKVHRNGQWEPVAVELGLSDGTYTEVKKGLKQGETVQVTPKLLK